MATKAWRTPASSSASTTGASIRARRSWSRTRTYGSSLPLPTRFGMNSDGRSTGTSGSVIPWSLIERLRGEPALDDRVERGERLEERLRQLRGQRQRRALVDERGLAAADDGDTRSAHPVRLHQASRMSFGRWWPGRWGRHAAGDVEQRGIDGHGGDRTVPAPPAPL